MNRLGSLRILMLEDSATDAEITERTLQESGTEIQTQRVTSRAEFEEALDQFRPDVLLLDYSLPMYDGKSALLLAKERCPQIPAVIVTGTIGEEAAVDLLKAGAADYVLKGHLARLAPAIHKALEAEQNRQARLEGQRQLESNLVLIQTIQESSPDGILAVDKNRRVISCNSRFFEMCDVPTHLRGKIDYQPLLRHVSGQLKAPGPFIDRVEYLYSHPDEKSYEELEMKDGRTFERHSSPMVDSSGKHLGRVWFYRDITERVASAQKLKLFRTLLDQSNDAIEIFDPETMRIIDVNDRACAELGYMRDELVGMHLSDLDPTAMDESARSRHQALEMTGHVMFESQHRRKNGSTFPVEVSVTRIQADRLYSLAVSRDITDRKRAEQVLEDSEIRFRTLIEDASDPVSVLTKDGEIQYTSPATLAMSGYRPEELIGRNMNEFVFARDLDKVAEVWTSVIQNPSTVGRLVVRLKCKDGSWRTGAGTLRNFLDAPTIHGLVLTLQDVTERERHLRALSALSLANAALVRASEERSLAKRICEILVDTGGYRMVWIGYPGHDDAKSVAPFAWSGQENGYLSSVKISWADSDRGRGPTGSAIRTAKTQIVRHYMTDPDTNPFHELAAQIGYASGISLPLMVRTEVLGAITLYSGEFKAFDEEEVRLLEELAADLAYGINTLRGQKQHAEDLQRLERGMEATIHAIANTLEKRDPYTTGHQQRVALLCSAIAKELGLSQERLRGLELAATIHDLGKVETPAEILSRPRQLTKLEYSLVQAHVQSGYDILKSLDFPWPIAEMVVQHHERLDGTGYPNGLHAEDIILESRILMVADMVEAMSSHRPYRPGKGIDVALATILEERGTKLDPQVVDACVKLFREDHFAY